MSSERTLPDYPFRWEGLEDFSYPKDEHGLPLVDMGGKLGLRYNPITISQFGLFNLQKYSATSDKSFLEKSTVCADWLIENFTDWRDDIGAWIYDYGIDFYGPEAPWISGMAQGQALSLLLRCHQFQKIENFLKLSERAFNAFLHPVREGGVVSSFPDSSLIFEEYPTNPPSQVLNGHMFALLGIHDYAEYWDKSEARDLFKFAVEGLCKNLNRYDTGYWNFYDQHPSRRLASAMYIKVHVQLLSILYEISGEQTLLTFVNKWQSYLNNPICRVRWFATKVGEKIRLASKVNKKY